VARRVRVTGRASLSDDVALDRGENWLCAQIRAPRCRKISPRGDALPAYDHAGRLLVTNRRRHREEEGWIRGIQTGNPFCQLFMPVPSVSRNPPAVRGQAVLLQPCVGTVEAGD